MKSTTTTSRLYNILEDALFQELDQAEQNLGLDETTTTTDTAVEVPKQEEEEEEKSSAATTTTTSSSRPMKVTDAAAIIAGTAIGGGFLALPSFTSPIGYLPTLLGLTLSYVFLVLSAIAFVEAAGLAEDDNQTNGDASTPGGTSVAFVIKHAFGKKWAVVAGLGFIAQILAVMTAQIVKGAEMLSHVTGMPYRVACVAPMAMIGLFVHASKTETVEGFNTLLTTVMLAGFAALITSAFSRGNFLAGLFANPDWTRLLPNMKTPFAMPIFIKLLAFGEAMPFLVERMVFGQQRTSSSSSSSNTTDQKIPTQVVAKKDQKMSAYRKIRKATVFGAGLPLVLAAIWAAISAALVDPSNVNPIASLLSNYGRSISIPVLLLAYGAIGTTLLGGLLAMTHFANDVICSKLGSCSTSRRWSLAANFLTLALPCTLACVGPSLYIPLLAFAGAYPTTILYGLAPPLAALTLRRRLKKNNVDEQAITPRLVPGGDKTLVSLVCTAVGLVGASTVLATLHFLKLFS